MFCPNCGNQLADEAVFCPNCKYTIQKIETATRKKKLYEKWWFWVIIVFAVVVIGAAAGGGSAETPESVPAVTEAPETPEPEAQTNSNEEIYAAATEKEQQTEEVDEPPHEVIETPEIEEPILPDMTMGEANALESAEAYLSFMAFSYSGLIEQLEYEGFTTDEAVFAADNCGADWNEQAAKCAQEYLDTFAFSREELIDQLEYEGFTYDQAVYGVEAVGY